MTPKQIKDVLALNIGRPAIGGNVGGPVPGAPQQPHHPQPFPGAPHQQPQFPGAPGQQPQFPGAPHQQQFPGAPGQFPSPQNPHQPVGPKLSLTGAPPHAVPYNKFLQPISECEATICDLIEQIGVDRWPVPQGHRQLRATGSALAVAVGLLEVGRIRCGIET